MKIWKIVGLNSRSQTEVTDEDIETTNILAYKSKIISTRKHTINIWYSACRTDPQITPTDHVTCKDIL